MTKLFALVTLVLLAAWPSSALADTVKLTIYSDPAGATVTANASDNMYGYAPVTIPYERLPKGFLKGITCISTQRILVRWASGAEVSLPQGIRICPDNGKNQTFTVVRPTGAPGRDIDIGFALELARLAEMRAIREDERAARLAESWRAYYARRREIYEEYLRRRVNCTSTVSGDYVYTNCY